MRAGCFELWHFVAKETISEAAGTYNGQHSPRDTGGIAPAENA
jgi:hypothetical protein